MDETIYKHIEAPLYCMTCNQSYGPTGLTYRGVDIWLACGCSKLKDSEIAFMNRNNLKLKQDYEKCNF